MKRQVYTIWDSNTCCRVDHGLGRPAGWVGSGRVGSIFCSFWWVGLSWVECDKSTIFFDDYTTHNGKGSCKLNTRGMKNWRFSTNISLYLENGTRYGRSYNGRPLTADSFAVSCIGLGWVHSFRFAMGWVGLGWVTQLMGWVGSPKIDPRTTLTCCDSCRRIFTTSMTCNTVFVIVENTDGRGKRATRKVCCRYRCYFRLLYCTSTRCYWRYICFRLYCYYC